MDLPAHHSAEEVFAHPQFAAARNALLRAMLDIYENDPFLNRLLHQVGRNVLFVVIMCLHARHDPDDPATWPTLRLVQQSMAGFNVGSPRRIADLVSRLIGVGYLEQRSAPGDRRIRILQPTAHMIAQDQDWLISHYVPLQVMFPKPGYGPIMQRDPAFQNIHRLVSASLFPMGAQLLARNPLMMRFMTRESGMMVLIKLMQLAGADDDVTRPISYSDLGASFGVSRTQVRTLLRDAETNALLRVAKGKGRAVRLTPKLIAAFDSFIADAMAGHDLVYKLAQRALAANPNRSMQQVPLSA